MQSPTVPSRPGTNGPVAPGVEEEALCTSEDTSEAIPFHFWSAEVPCRFQQAEATFWPSALTITDKLLVCGHGASSFLNSALSGRPRVPVQAGVTNWDFFSPESAPALSTLGRCL